MKTMLKPILLIAATLMAVLFIVFCSTLLWIKSNHGLQWALARINTTIPGSITITDHRLLLLAPELDLYEVALHDPRDNPLAGFSHLRVRLDWWSLWRGEIRLETILLEAPWADLAVHKTNGLNLTNALVPPARENEKQASPTDGVGLPFNILFESIQLTDGRFTFTPADDTTRLETTGITLTADGNLMNKSGNLDLVLADVRFSSAGIRPEPARIALKAHLNYDKLSVSAFDVTSGQTTLTLAGSADHLYTMPLIDSVLSIDSQLNEIKSIFNLSGDFAGPAKTTLALKGTLANPDAELVLKVDDGRVAGQPMDRGDLSMKLHDRQVTIDTAAFRLADGAVILNGTVDLREAFPKGFSSPPADIDTIAYTLALVQNIPDLNPWLKSFIEISGAATGRVSINGKGVTPSNIFAQLALKGSGQKLTVTGMDRPVDADVGFSAQMDRGHISISRLDATADGVKLSGDGRFQMDNRTISGKMLLSAEDLSRVMAVVGMPFVHGACHATLTVDGSLSRPQFSVELDSKDLKVDTYTIGDLIIDADMDHDSLINLHTLTIQNQDSRIHGSGRLRLLPGGGIDPGFVNAVDFNIEKFSAADFMTSPPLDGTLDGRLQASGPLTSLQGSLSLTGASLSTMAVTIGDMDARLRLDDGVVHIDRLVLNNQASTLTAGGSIQLLAPGTLHLLPDPPIKLTAASDHIDPSDFIDAVKGKFTLDARLTGSLENPSGTITLNGNQVDIAGQSIENLSLNTRLDARRLWLDRVLATVAPGEQIEANGWVGLDQSMAFQVKTDGIALGHIQRLHDLFPGRGILRFNASVEGNIKNPDVEGRLSVSDVTINDKAIEDMHLTFSLHEMRLKAAGDLNVDVGAACDLKQGDFDLHLVFDDTETAPYFRAAGMPDLHGTLTGRVDANGNIGDITNASANVELDSLHLLSKKNSLIKANRITMQLADQKLSIPEFEMAILTTGSLRLKGDVDFDDHLNITIDGRIPLAAAGAFSQELADAAGMVALDGNISGDMNAPLIDARIELTDVAMAVPGLVQKLHDLNGRIFLTADTIRIEAMKGFLDTGSFSLAGSVDYDNFKPTRMNLSVNARALPLEVPDTLTVLINSDITLSGSDRSATARGDIVVLEGLYYKDVKINLLELATARQRAVPPAQRPLSIPYYDTVGLDIAIRHRQAFAVENNLAQLNISPDLKVGGTLANPILSGRAQVRDGSVTFQKKTFDVQKGVIDFVNPYKTEAEIDIVSKAVIRSWTISLAIKGTPDNLNLQLSSVPSETDSDILSIVLFGRTAKELTDGEGGGAKRTTGQIMAELIADTFGDDIKKQTGVDILQVEENGGNGDQDIGGVKVTVGKHLSDRMTVKYAVETKDGEIIQRAITEYKLLENILVSGFQDSKGIYGSELVFRIEFR